MVANFMLMKGLVYLSILPEVEFELVHNTCTSHLECCGNMQLSLEECAMKCYVCMTVSLAIPET